jgi:uncharacterized membrane protein YsdA (DUF1294 family)
MPLIPTLIATAFALALTVLFGWLGARPARLFARPRLVPWRFLMLLAFTMVIATLVHAVALLRATNGS